MLQRGDRSQSSDQSGSGELLTAFLRLAAQTGSVEGIRARLGKGDAVNGRDDAGRTALMIAASHGHGDACMTLLELGADATARTLAGGMAADFARRAGHDELADRLLVGDGDPGLVAPAEPTGRRIDVSAFDSFEWETEGENLAPADDITIRHQASEAQAAFGRHVAVDHAEDWHDVEAFLPVVAAPINRPRDATFDSLRRVASRALTNGVVCLSELTGSLLGDPDLTCEREEDLLRHLQRSLADAGVLIEDVHTELVPALSSGEDDDLDSSCYERAAEIADWVMALGSGRDDPMWHWTHQMQAIGDLLTHEEEIRLGAEIRDALTSGIRALLQCERGRSALLATVSRARATGGQGDPDDPDESTTVVSDAIGDDEQAPEVPTLDEILCRLAEGDYRFNEKDVQALEHWMRRHPSGLASLDRAVVHLRKVDPQRVVSSGLHGHVAKLSAARDEFVNRNLRLVFATARKFSYAGMSFSDLLQEGSIGLMKAVARYDADRGFRFSTYATWWVRQTITRARQTQARLIRLPVHVEEQVRSVTLASESLEARLGRPPRREELEAETGIQASKVCRLLSLSEQTVWIDDEASSDWLTLGDRFWPFEANDEDSNHSLQLRDLVRSRLATLSKKEAMVVVMRYGIGAGHEHTLEEVGRAFGLTRERVRQIENKVLKRLRLKLTRESELQESLAHAAVTVVVAERVEHDRIGDSTDHPPSSEAKSAPAISEVLLPPSFAEVRDVLDILSSPVRQLQLAKSRDVFSPQRELAKLWFTTYSSAEPKSFSATQHEDFRSLTIALRGSLRLLGFGAVQASELLSDPSWQAVISTATRARSSLEAPSAGVPPLHEATDEHA